MKARAVGTTSDRTQLTAPLPRTGSEGIVQRLLILQVDLPYYCTGKALDEDASVEERSENILYFHSTVPDDTSTSTTPSDDSTRFTAATNGDAQSAVALSDRHPSWFGNQNISYYSNQQAVEFAGLCTALYTLPLAMNIRNERTSVVYLDHCFLVFELLEDPNIVAVAQVARCPVDEAATGPKPKGGTPSAVGSALQKSYRLFRLLRGGGIRRRLQAFKMKKTEEQYMTEGPYYGMKRLFDLRRQVRRIRGELRRGERDREDLEARLNEVQQDLFVLLRHLPIWSVRKDLRDHFDSWLGDIAEGSSGTCRNVVEHLPSPIPLLSGDHTFTSAPVELDPLVIYKLSTVLQNLLHQQERLRSGSARILGVSTFLSGHFVSTEMERDHMKIPIETSHTLMWYFASFRSSMYKRKSQPSSGTSTPEVKRPFRPFALTFGSDINDTSTVTRVNDIPATQFLPPPSLSLLSTSDEGHDIDGPEDKQKVWAPPISIVSGESYVEMRVCLYDTRDFSFLVYLVHPDDSSAENRSTYRGLLELFHRHIDASIKGILSEDGGVGDKEQEMSLGRTMSWGGVGQDVVLLDRSTQSLGLFLHERKTGRDRKAHYGIREKLWFYSSKKSQVDDEPAGMPDTVERYIAAFRVDCRHLLASYLSLDALLAFDDVAEELRSRSGSDSRPLTICTLLKNVWIYAHSDGKRELYVFFESQVYVTVADVQREAETIRRELLR